LHGEAEDVATEIANPALPALAIWINLQARASVVMPWTARNKPPTLAAQIETASHQVDNVDGATNTFFQILIDGEGHRHLLWQ
jgi:hypothetical protein